MNGGLGNDTMDGGGGTNDVAVFNATAEQMSFAWSAYGGRLTVTSPDGIDVVTNTEWLRFNATDGVLPDPYTVPITGVVARNDTATALGDALSLTAAQLLANDTSLKYGAALSLVTGPDGWVGTTTEGVDVYVDGSGNVYFGPSDYDLLPDIETLETRFTYQVTNGTGHTDSAEVVVTIQGTADVIDFEDVPAAVPFGLIEPGYRGYNWFSFVNVQGTDIDTLDLTRLVNLPSQEPYFQPVLLDPIPLFVVDTAYYDQATPFAANTGFVNANVAPGSQAALPYISLFIGEALTAPDTYDIGMLVTSDLWTPTAGLTVDTSFNFHGLSATSFYGALDVDFIGMRWDAVDGWIPTYASSYTLNSDTPTLVAPDWGPIDALLILAVGASEVLPPSMEPTNPVENFVLFDNVVMSSAGGVILP
jgi:hypothetical protein